MFAALKRGASSRASASAKHLRPEVLPLQSLPTNGKSLEHGLAALLPRSHLSRSAGSVTVPEQGLAALSTSTSFPLSASLPSRSSSAWTLLPRHTMGKDLPSFQHTQQESLHESAAASLLSSTSSSIPLSNRSSLPQRAMLGGSGWLSSSSPSHCLPSFSSLHQQQQQQPLRAFHSSAALQGGRHTNTVPERVRKWRQHISKKAEKRYKKRKESFMEKRKAERAAAAAKQQQQQEQQAGNALVPSGSSSLTTLPPPAVLQAQSKANALIIETFLSANGSVPKPQEQLQSVNADALLQGLQEGLLPKDLATFNHLIRVLGAQGRFQEALQCYADMREAGVAPTAFTFTALLSACSQQKNLQAAWEVFEGMLESGIAPTEASYGALMQSAIKAGNLQEAFRILELAEQQLLKRGGGGGGPSLLLQQLEAAGAGGSAAGAGKAAALEASTPSLPPSSLSPSGPSKLSPVLFTHLITGCIHMGHYERAVDVYRYMRRYHCEPDTVCFNALINACAKTDQVEKALNFLTEMKHMGLALDHITYNTLIHASGRSFRKYAHAFDLFAEMPVAGFQPDRYSYNAVILACSHSGAVERARGYLHAMVKQGLQPDLVTVNSLLAVYARAVRLSKSARQSREKQAALVGSGTQAGVGASGKHRPAAGWGPGPAGSLLALEDPDKAAQLFQGTKVRGKGGRGCRKGWLQQVAGRQIDR